MTALLGVSRTADEVFLLVFGGIAVIVVTARVVGQLFGRLGLPTVVGEVVGGVLLGPSVLGLLPGDPSALLFPPDIQPYLRIIASFGLVIYMFIVGLELDPRTVGAERRAAVTISLTSVATPFVLGALTGLLIYSAHDVATTEIDGVPVPVDVDRLAFVLFCGLAICGSAFAILARILHERRLFRTRIGGVLLASTVVDDIVVWMLASVVLAIAAAGGPAEVPLVLGGLLAFVLVLFGVVRPLLRRLMAPSARDEHGLSADVFAAILVGLLAAALFTTWLGISPILGAFFFGAAVPREGTHRLFAQMNERLESVSVLVLLPVFFAVTGLGVDLSAIGLDGLGLLVVFVVVATAGKMLGAAVGASFNGIRGRRAFGVGVLMNTRGLSELAILSIGLSLGILDTTMFTVLVCTAIVTTLVSGPLLGIVYPQRMIDADIAAAERSRIAGSAAYQVLVVVDDPGSADAAIDVAIAVARSEPDASIAIGRVALAGPTTELGTGFMGDLTRATAALAEVRELSTRVTDAGVDAVPHSQITDDVGREVIAMVDRLHPHLVVLPPATHGAHPTLADELAEHHHVDVATVHGESHPFATVRTVNGGSERHRIAVAEVAVRAAVGTALPIDTDQRVVQDLAAMLDVPLADHSRPGGELVVMATDAFGADAIREPGGDTVTLVRVRAHASTAGPRRIEPIAERLRRRTGT